jgi:hypothetical protein
MSKAIICAALVVLTSSLLALADQVSEMAKAALRFEAYESRCGDHLPGQRDFMWTAFGNPPAGVISTPDASRPGPRKSDLRKPQWRHERLCATVREQLE